MTTRESRRQRGRRHGDQLLRGLVTQLRNERLVAGLSQRAVGSQVGMSQGELSRLERFDFPNIAFVRLAEIAAVLGLELSAGLQ